jgi:hypothetical protein
MVFISSNNHTHWYLLILGRFHKMVENYPKVQVDVEVEYLWKYKWDDMNHTCLLFDYFCDCFWGNILKIFIEYSLKSH